MNLNHTIAWEKCLTEIKGLVDEKTFRTWFAPIKSVKLEDSVLTIQVPNKFFYDWIEENYIDLLGKVLYKHLGKNAGLEYQILVEDHRDIEGNYKQSLEKKLKENKIIDFLNEEFNQSVNSNYTFDNFVQGDCNKLARNAAVSITGNLGKSAFNPLIIYGGVGLGKTHIINAIGNEIKKGNTNPRIVYTNTERFTNQIIKALRDNQIYEFINSFQMVDIFMIDDIQFLEGRTKTQEIFFNIFNYMHQNDKQLVITSDRPPHELQGIQERLISRFKWGLVADIQKPDLETRIKILESKAQRDQLYLTPDVLNFIGHNVTGSIRDLEGVLVSLSAHSTLNERIIDLELTSEVVDKISHTDRRVISIDNIQQIISDHFGIPISSINGKSRKKEIVTARQLGIYFSKEMTDRPLKDIGRTFGGRDHSTVLYSIKSVNNQIDVDPLFSELVVKLRNKLENSLIKSYN